MITARFVAIVETDFKKNPIQYYIKKKINQQYLKQNNIHHLTFMGPCIIII
jgi:hypothetical protein